MYVYMLGGVYTYMYDSIYIYIYTDMCVCVCVCVCVCAFQARPQNCEKRLLSSSRLSVRPSAQNNSTPIGQIFVKFQDFIENLYKKFKIHEDLTRMTGTVHEDVCHFIISRSILLRLRNVSDKRLQGKSKYTFYVQ